MENEGPRSDQIGASSPVPLHLTLNATSSKKPPLTTPPKADLCYPLFQPLLYCSFFTCSISSIRMSAPRGWELHMHRA